MFNIERKITNSKFILLSDKKSSIDFDIVTKNNENISSIINVGTGEVYMKINNVDLMWNISKKYISSELFPKLEYKIKISNYDNSKICVLIFDEFLGEDYNIINNYEPIFWYNL